MSLYEQALAAGARPEAVFRRLGSLYLAQEELGRADEYFRRALEGQLDVLNPYREMLLRAREDFGNSSPNIWPGSRRKKHGSLRKWIWREPTTWPYSGRCSRRILRSPRRRTTWIHRTPARERAGGRRALQALLRDLAGNPDARNNLQILEKSI